MFSENSTIVMQLPCCPAANSIRSGTPLSASCRFPEAGFSVLWNWTKVDAFGSLPFFENLISHKKDVRIRLRGKQQLALSGVPDLMELAAAVA